MMAPASASAEPGQIFVKRYRSLSPMPATADNLQVQAAFGRQIRWSNLLLGEVEPLRLDDGPTAAQRQALNGTTVLGLPRPNVGGSLATAATSLLLGAGIALWEKDHPQMGRRKHFMRAYFRKGGVGLAWRCQF